MPQICKACAHPERAAIDAVLVAGRPSLREIGAQYGVSKDSLLRHYHAHIPDDDQNEPTATEQAESGPVLNNQSKSNGVAEARQADAGAENKGDDSVLKQGKTTEPEEADTILKSGKNVEPEDAEARYTAFLEHWRFNIGFKLGDMADWPEKGEDLQALISEGIERGDLFYYAGLRWYCKTAECIRRMNRDK